MKDNEEYIKKLEGLNLQLQSQADKFYSMKTLSPQEQNILKALQNANKRILAENKELKEKIERLQKELKELKDARVHSET